MNRPSVVIQFPLEVRDLLFDFAFVGAPACLP